jgi:polysaccharide biosynthesis/export protein
MPFCRTLSLCLLLIAATFFAAGPASGDTPSLTPISTTSPAVPPALSLPSPAAAPQEVGVLRVEVPAGQAAAKDAAAGAAPLPQAPEPSYVERAMQSYDSSDIMRAQPFRLGNLTQFGYSFFRPQASGFDPVTDLPVGPDYMVGTGDRLNVTLWGSIDGSYDLEVNRSGEITLPRAGAVKVSGVPFGQLPKLLSAKLSTVFANFQISVTMGKVRLIKVYLVGEVQAPGDYNVSSLSTLINALGAAGGPTRNGSLRSIAIKRNGKLAETVDLYDFFLKGDKSRDIRLQPGDTVYVPTVQAVVGVAGNVRRPGIYELKNEKNLNEVLELADGIVPTAYLQRLQISRTEAHDKKVVADLSLDPKGTGKSVEELTSSIPVKDMDLVKVFPIDFTIRDRAKLDGYVLRPGLYTLKPGMRLRELIGQNNLLPEYFPDTVEVTRLTPPELQPQKIYLNLEKALKGDPEQNILLAEFDTVRVFSRAEMEEMPLVTISGEVNRPGSYRLTKGERVADLVKEGGNLKRQGYARKVELRRLKLGEERLTPYSVYIDLEEAVKGNPQQNLPLQPFDEIVVKKWDVEAPKVVRVSGEVQKPGSYRLVEGMTISDLVQEAGNITKSAFLKHAEITRLSITGKSVTSYPITVRLEEALAGDPEANVRLQEQDEVMIRRLPEWVDETERYVTLKGEVQFPGSYPIYKGEKLSSVLRRAGGYTDKAYLKGAKFTRKSVQLLQQKRMEEVIARTEQDLAHKQQEMSQVASSKEELEATRATLEGIKVRLDKLKTAKAEGRVSIKLAAADTLSGSPYDLELQGGDVLEIPQSTNSVLVFGEVYNPTTVVHIPGEDLAYYLGRAGGATGAGEEDEMYVIRADGTVESRKQSARFLFYDSFQGMKLDPGDSIVVPQAIGRVAWMRELKDIAYIVGQTALAAGVLVAAGL